MEFTPQLGLDSGHGDMPAFYSIYGVVCALEFTGWIDELQSITNTCYIGDWSWLFKYRLTGPDLWRCLEANTVNNYRNFLVGKGKHIIGVNENGKIVGEGIVFKLSEDEVLITGGHCIGPGFMLGKLEGFDVECTEVSAEEYCFHVQGPNSRMALEKAAGEDLSDIKFGYFRNITIAGRKLRIYRGGMSGELGYELHGPSADGSVIWQAVVDNGAEYGIRQLGQKTLMANHLQAFFPTNWLDFIPAVPGTEGAEALYRSPVDYGWGNCIDKEREFTGKAALMKELEAPTHKTMTLERNSEDCMAIYASLFDENEEPFEQIDLPTPYTNTTSSPLALPVFSSDGQMVGLATNRGYSYKYRKIISVTQLDIKYTEIGTEVFVLYGNEGKRQTKIRATVKPAPYKTDKRR